MLDSMRLMDSPLVSVVALLLLACGVAGEQGRLLPGPGRAMMSSSRSGARGESAFVVSVDAWLRVTRDMSASGSALAKEAAEEPRRRAPCSGPGPGPRHRRTCLVRRAFAIIFRQRGHVTGVVITRRHGEPEKTRRGRPSRAFLPLPARRARRTSRPCWCCVWPARNTPLLHTHIARPRSRNATI